MSHVLVSDEHRLNELSLIPGGVTLTVVHSNGTKRSYDKIKNAQKYIAAILHKADVVEVWHESECLYRK